MKSINWPTALIVLGILGLVAWGMFLDRQDAGRVVEHVLTGALGIAAASSPALFKAAETQGDS